MKRGRLEQKQPPGEPVIWGGVRWPHLLWGNGVYSVAASASEWIPIGCPLAATSETLILTVRRYFARKRIRLTLESSVGLVFRVQLPPFVFPGCGSYANPASFVIQRDPSGPHRLAREAIGSRGHGAQKSRPAFRLPHRLLLACHRAICSLAILRCATGNPPICRLPTPPEKP